MDVTRHLITKGASMVAVDANGMTPALSCAPNVNVAQCLAIILSNYPKQPGFNANMLAKGNILLFSILFVQSMPSYTIGIPELFYLTLFPKRNPKSKTEILTEHPKRSKSIQSLVNSFKDERERSESRLSKINTTWQELKPICDDSDCAQVNLEEVACLNLFNNTNSFNKKSDISQIFQNKKENIRSNLNCFIIENFTHSEHIVIVEDDDRHGFNLHHSSTSMALTKHKIYSDDDYREIVRNTYQDDSKTQTKLSTLKPIPRRVSDVFSRKSDEIGDVILEGNNEDVMVATEKTKKGNSKGLKKFSVEQKHKSASSTRFVATI